MTAKNSNLLSAMEAFMLENEVREVRRRMSGMGHYVLLFDGSAGVGDTIEAALEHARFNAEQHRRSWAA